MRLTFVKTLTELARNDKKIILLTADLGFMVFDDFKKEFPEQYINVGVAEANMMSMATGLAMTGYIVYVYSIIPFLAYRTVEQIRNDVVHHKANVKLVGVGQGFSYGSHGSTHHAIEDIGVLRSLQELPILSPADPSEVESVVKWSVRHKGPCYIRLGKVGEPVLGLVEPEYTLGKSRLLKEGTDVTVFTIGSIAGVVLGAANELEKEGISCAVVSMISVKPVDKYAIKEALKTSKAIITVEEHSIIGGLGSAVSEIYAESNPNIPFARIGVEDKIADKIGSQDFLRHKNGLSKENIKQKVKQLLS